MGCGSSVHAIKPAEAATLGGSSEETAAGSVESSKDIKKAEAAHPIVSDMSGSPPVASPQSSNVILPSGAKVTVPYPINLAELVKNPELCGTPEDPTVALNVEGLMQPLWATIPISKGAKVSPVIASSQDGNNAMKRSFIFLMMMAAKKEFGKDWFVTAKHTIGPSQGGYFCIVNQGERSVTKEEVEKLKKRMQDLVEKDLPLHDRIMGHQEAVDYFTSEGKRFSKTLVEASNEFLLRCVSCDDYCEIYRRALVPRLGMLKGNWELTQFEEGFAITFPRVGSYTKVAEFEADSVITNVYKDWGRVGRAANVVCVGDVNEQVVGSKAKNFIAQSEALQTQRMVKLALDIQGRVAKGVQLVLIAGPSSSGKTTFASKLALQLSILGIKPSVLSVDNYYKCHADCPRDDKGNLDFEVLEALRVDLLNEHLLDLFEGKTVQCPIFNFHTGKPETRTSPFSMAPGGVIIMEGIHCLNDRLTPRVPLDKKYKIFLAPLCYLNLDESNFLSNSTTRLIRRIVRDYRTRGYSAMDTLSRWYSVRRGEDQNIFPFMQNADYVFNTALDYEVNVLKTFCKPLLKGIKPGNPQYNQTQELLWFMSHFHSVPHDDVPPDSLLREFIGGSFFEHKHQASQLFI